MGPPSLVLKFFGLCPRRRAGSGTSYAPRPRLPQGIWGSQASHNTVPCEQRLVYGAVSRYHVYSWFIRLKPFPAFFAESDV